jgi:selenophosphate synthase
MVTNLTLKMKSKHILCDPQTSGGLLIAVKRGCKSGINSKKTKGFMLNL